MSKKKIVILDEAMDKVLGTICDLALKGAGMQAVSSVNTLIDAIEEDSEERDLILD